MSARPFEQIGRRSPFLDQQDLFAAVGLEAASQLHVQEAGLRSKLCDLGAQQFIEGPHVALLHMGGEDAQDHAERVTQSTSLPAGSAWC